MVKINIKVFPLWLYCVCMVFKNVYLNVDLVWCFLMFRNYIGGYHAKYIGNAFLHDILQYNFLNIKNNHTPMSTSGLNIFQIPYDNTTNITIKGILRIPFYHFWLFSLYYIYIKMLFFPLFYLFCRLKLNILQNSHPNSIAFSIEILLLIKNI